MEISKLNFYNSVLEFFSIILPGFVVTLIFFVHHWEDLVPRFMVDAKFQSFYFNLVFLLLSYVVGQGLFQLGSIIDKLTYDRFKKIIYNEKSDINLSLIQNIRKKLFADFKNSYKAPEKNQFQHINNYQWSLSYLRQNDSKAFSEVEKIMADSKFFRSIFAASLLYIFCYDLMHTYSNLGTTVILFTIIYLAFYLYSKFSSKTSRKDSTNDSDEKSNEENDDENANNSPFYYAWIFVSIIFYVLVLYFFYAQSNTFSCANQDITLKLFEVCGEYNVFIVVVNLISLILYFRIRKKSTRKTYQYAVYNLKLKK